MNHQNTRNNTCGENRCNSCSYGRTPWGSRECNGCTRRAWNTRGTCGCNNTTPRSSCPCTANTTWRNRGEGCACSTARQSTCSCNETRQVRSTCPSAVETRSTCGCSRERDSDCDSDCNHGAANTGILAGKSLAMVYSPYQSFDSVYDPRQGLCNGTIFGELNKPFYGDGRGC